MPSAAEVVERVRSLGANITVDGDKLSIQNRNKLPPEAIAYVRKHAETIADFICAEAEIDQRAAIMEHDGEVPRDIADFCARAMIPGIPAGISEADRSFYITAIGRIVDEVFLPANDLARAA